MTRFTLSAPVSCLGHSVMVGAELSSPPDAVVPGAAAAPRRAGATGGTNPGVGAPRGASSAAGGASRLPHATATAHAIASGQRRATRMMYYGIAPGAPAVLNRPAC